MEIEEIRKHNELEKQTDSYKLKDRYSPPLHQVHIDFLLTALAEKQTIIEQLCFDNRIAKEISDKEITRLNGLVEKARECYEKWKDIDVPAPEDTESINFTLEMWQIIREIVENDRP